MALKMLYFGLIAEAIQRTEEVLDISKTISVSDLTSVLTEKYSVLAPLSYKVAVNKQLASPDTLITNDSEIALLPPFAGG